MADDRPELTTAADLAAEAHRALTGTLHIFVAFDWGDEVDLEHARRLVPSRPHELPRRRRTPSSIAYRPAPLRVRLPPARITLAELGEVTPETEATLFDFAAVSLAMHVPLHMNSPALTRLAGSLAEPGPLVAAARAALTPLFEVLGPAIQGAGWSELSEEYFVFRLSPMGMPAAADLLRREGSWLAGLVRLESQPLSEEEVAEALRQRLSYSPNDLLVCEWSAAVLLDEDCDETLHAIEFANLQLLEFRVIDGRLDEELAAAYRRMHSLSRGWLPPWRTHSRPLRALGDMRIEANALFERTTNVLKLLGDQYLARAYRMLAARFHLEEWAYSIHRSLEVGLGAYQVLSDQAANYRMEFLEIVIIVLILFEIMLTLVGH